MFIVSSLISSTFSISPGFSHTEDLEFEVLDEEALWAATSAQEWRELRGTGFSGALPTVRDAMANIIFDENRVSTDHPREISGLTMLLITHALNIYLGGLRQVIETSSEHLRKVMLESALSALSRCQGIILQTRGKDAQSEAWTEAEGPLMFNCQGVLLMGYVRSFANIGAFNHLTLLADNPDDIVSAARSYAEAPLQRGQTLTNAIRKAYEKLLSTARLGHLLLRKTAAFSWSLEHAIAGWVASKKRLTHKSPYYLLTTK